MSKQTAVEWLENQLKNVKYNPLEKNGYTNALNNLYAQAKQMEKDQIIGAYDREVIDGIQNWFVGNGTHYYELHYEGKSGIREYNNPGETSRENKHTTDENYSFEDGV